MKTIKKHKTFKLHVDFHTSMLLFLSHCSYSCPPQVSLPCCLFTLSCPLPALSFTSSLHRLSLYLEEGLTTDYLPWWRAHVWLFTLLKGSRLTTYLAEGLTSDYLPCWRAHDWLLALLKGSLTTGYLPWGRTWRRARRRRDGGAAGQQPGAAWSVPTHATAQTDRRREGRCQRKCPRISRARTDTQMVTIFPSR